MLEDDDVRTPGASLAISAGAYPKLVQRMLGHASAAMTLDVSADLFDSDHICRGKCVQNVATTSLIARLFETENALTSAYAEGKAEPPVRIELFSTKLVRGSKRPLAAKSHHGNSH